MRLNHWVLIIFIVVAIGIFTVFLGINWSQANGEIVMPLDDVYIHFQYARQLALGEPYVYNPGDLPTSGATSFIYPYILAFGYLIGFQGLNLGIWAMIAGCFALLGAMWAIYRLCYIFDAPIWLAVLTPISFVLTGSFSWHAVSGMETLLIVCFSLWTLLAFIEKRVSLFAVVAILLALTRPEGSIMAGIASGLYILRTLSDKSIQFKFKHTVFLSLPILAFGIQPTVNFLLTGSFSSSGGQAKSLLGVIPQDWSIIISRIVDNFLRIWLELLTGYNPSQDLWYVIILTVPMGVIGLFLLLRRREYCLVVLMLVLWMLAVSGAISTLDTAFWHFKRYQMPLFALFVPLSVIPVVWTLKQFPQARWGVYAFDIVIVPLFVVLSLSAFLHRYEVNLNYVRQQPLAMAHWLSENTSEDAVVAVHDVGMMRYMGNRKTLDIVGLTTPSAAQYWRNGVGSVAEFLMIHQPDFIASYGRGHGYGLYMLEETSIYGEPLAEFVVNLDLKLNVALAGDRQAIYQPDWNAIIPPTSDENILLEINVADIDSENAKYYNWQNIDSVTGFATVAYQFDLLGCDVSHSRSCNIVDGARQITGEESFVADLSGIERSEPLILKTRVHAVDAISLDIYVAGKLVDTQWIPENSGKWLDIETYIPSRDLYSAARINIVPNLDLGEVYVPARHTIIDPETTISDPPATKLASYQDEHLQLIGYDIELSNDQLELGLDWYSDGQTTGDYRFFVHIYDDIDQPPVAQWDDYLGNSTLPLGNWLVGTRRDTINLDTSSLALGKYILMIGFYEPETQERLMSLNHNDGIHVQPDGRLVLQILEIK